MRISDWSSDVCSSDLTAASRHRLCVPGTAAGRREHVGCPSRFCCHRARADRLQPGSKRMNHWLMKSEPDAFSIDELKRKKQEAWDGVRNYQARNFMRDGMRPGDKTSEERRVGTDCVSTCR